MHRFWENFLLPVARGCEARVICEIGSQYGDLTERVLAFCLEAGAVAHVIEPAPRFDVPAWQTRYGEAFVLHEALSLEVLGDIPVPDLVLIDGDHNWYTVVSELRLLERSSVLDDRLPPVIALHDVGWPYARRDLYYHPETIPEESRQPHERRGIRPGQNELTSGGINDHLNHALNEHGPRNGVLTAVEDFLAESQIEWASKTIPGFHGLGLLAPAARLERQAGLASALEGWDEPPVLHSHLEAVESGRIRIWLEQVEADRRADRRAEEARQEKQIIERRHAEEAKHHRAQVHELDRARRRERARVRREVERIAESRTWRYGQRASRGIRLLAGRSRHAQPNLTEALLEYLDSEAGPAPLPPDSLRFMGEDDARFREIGDQLVRDLRYLGVLEDTSDVADIGSGYGRLAHALQRDPKFAGTYEGLDVLKRHVAWCNENLASRHYGFTHLDVQNDRYNPEGETPATEVELPLRRRSVDLAVLTSVFTHLWPYEVVHYLHEVRRVLRRGGRAYATFFLMNDSWRELEDAGRSGRPMKHRHSEYCRYHDAEDPLHAISYEQEWVADRADEAGLEVEEVLLGAWCGRDDRPRFQDVAILRRRRATSLRGTRRVE